MEEVVLLADDWKGVGEKDKAVGATARVAASVAMEEIFMVSWRWDERDRSEVWFATIVYRYRYHRRSGFFSYPSFAWLTAGRLTHRDQLTWKS